MPVPLDFLQSIGVHALPLLAAGAAAATEVGSSILRAVWELWTKKKQEAERRKELETLAGMTSQQVKEAVREVVANLAKDEPPATQAKLAGYLAAVPAQIRRTLRRPSDATGLTIPPGLPLAEAIDLVPLLPPRPPRFAPGDKAPGTDFELVELLGIGGFGEVWKARNTFMPGAPAVALKFCLDPAAATSLRRETALLDRIQREGKHPGIVELRHTFLSAEPPYLEYELVEGGDLGGLIHDWHSEQGGPTPEQAARLIRRLADIVAFAHARGIVHRDLKPANVLVSGGEVARLRGGDKDSPPPHQLKVADFGIGGIAAEAAARQARLTQGGTLTAAAAHGSYSLYYASPEQMRGAAPDPRDDVHALGVIWYQALVGDLTAEAPRGAGWKKRLGVKGMSAALIELLESCVASERDDRPANAGEVAERLTVLLSEPAPETRPTPAPRLVPSLPPLNPLPGRTESEPGVPRPVVDEALRRSRWIDFVNRLRAIRFGHARLRWASGIICWLVPLGIIALATGVVGCQTYWALLSESYDQNRSIGNEIAAKYSTTGTPIEWYSSSSGGYFRLGVSTVTVRPNAPQDTSENPPPSYVARLDSLNSSNRGGRYVSYSPVQVTSRSRELPPAIATRVDQYVTEANEKMAQATGEMGPVAAGRNDLLWGCIAGGATTVLLLVGYVLLRRWKRRKLEAFQKALIATTETEYAPELRDLPEALDLNQPEKIHRLITALEESGSASRPRFPNPPLIHRLLAPF